MKAKVSSCVLKDVRNLNLLPLVSISKGFDFWLALSCLFFISSIKYSRWYKWNLHPWCIQTNVGDQQSWKEIWGRRSDESVFIKKSCCDTHKQLWRWPGFIYGCLSVLNVSVRVFRDREQCWHVNHFRCILKIKGEAFPQGTHRFETDMLVWHFIESHWLRMKL